MKTFMMILLGAGVLIAAAKGVPRGDEQAAAAAPAGLSASDTALIASMKTQQAIEREIQNRGDGRPYLRLDSDRQACIKMADKKPGWWGVTYDNCVYAAVMRP